MIPPERHTEHGMTRGKTIILLFVLLAVFLVGWIFFSQDRDNRENGAKTAGDTFASALTAKDAETSYNLLTKKYQEAEAKSDWQAWVNFIFAEAEGEPRFVSEAPVQEPDQTYGDNSNATRLTYSFNFGGANYTTYFVAVQEDSAWKIAEIGGFEEE